MSRWRTSGESGSSRTSTPSGPSASPTALATAEAAPMVPPSAMPLKPLTVTGGGVSECTTSTDGSSIVVGRR